MALHVREVASEQPRRGFRSCREDAEHIVFEDRVSRRCENVECWGGRGVENLSPVRVAKCAVGCPADMGKKNPHTRFTLPRACEIEPAVIVARNAIEMRNQDAGVAVIKVVLLPIRSRLLNVLVMPNSSYVNVLSSGAAYACWTLGIRRGGEWVAER